MAEYSEKTLKKLKDNPFYKLNEEQKGELREIERKPMEGFGNVEIHNDTVEKHQVKIIRRGRRKKNDKE